MLGAEVLSKKSVNVGLKIAADIAVLSVGYMLAYLLRFDGGMDASMQRSLFATLPLVVLLKVLILYFMGAYRGIYKYSSITDLLIILKATTLASIAALAVPTWLEVEHSRGVLIIDWLITIIVLGGVRFGARWMTQRLGVDPKGSKSLASRRLILNNGRKNGAKRVLVYGGGDTGEMIAREMTRGKYAETYRAIGFIDDDPRKQGQSIHGLPVLGQREDIARVVAEHKVEQIVITIPSARGRVIRSLLAACEKSGAQLQIVPGLEDIFDGGILVSGIRNVRVDDILGRDKVDLNLAAISSYITGKRILVTGAGGSIGSEICRQLIRFHPTELLLFGRGENSIFLLNEDLKNGDHGVAIRQIIGDVINKKKLAGVLKRYKPEIIFHAGADKHVTLMEINPDEAVLNNVIGTKNVLEVAQSHGIGRVVCISTDKAVNPTSVMGCCKRIAEMLVQSGHFSGTTACAVRFGNVLGSRGSVIPLFQKQIARGEPLTITHPDVRRYFMTITEASQLVIQAGALGQGSDLFLLDMGEPIRIVDLARDMIRLAGLEPDEDIPLKIVGLRAGEKLNEELWLPTERRIPTTHEKIMRVVSNGFDYDKLDREIRVLTQLAVEMDYVGIMRQLKLIVPEYDPQEEYHLLYPQAREDTALQSRRENVSS